MIGFSKFSAVTLGVFNSEVNETILSSSLAFAIGATNCEARNGYLVTSSTGAPANSTPIAGWEVHSNGSSTKRAFAEFNNKRYQCTSTDNKWKMCKDLDCSAYDDTFTAAEALPDLSGKTKCWVPKKTGTNFENEHTFIGEATSLECKEDAKTCSLNAEKCKYECDNGVLKSTLPTCVDKCGDSDVFKVKDDASNVLSNTAQFKAEGQCKDGHSFAEKIHMQCKSDKMEVNTVQGGVLGETAVVAGAVLAKDNKFLEKNLTKDEMEACHSADELCPRLSKEGCEDESFNEICEVDGDKKCVKKAFPLGALLGIIGGILLVVVVGLGIYYYRNRSKNQDGKYQEFK